MNFFKKMFFLWFLVIFFQNFVFGISTNRTANAFSLDEPFIVLNTNRTGTANWTLTNDYGDSISGTAQVSGGKIYIPTQGLVASRYTFSISGDGQIQGAIFPALMDIKPELGYLSFAPGRMSWNLNSGYLNPQDALLYKQAGVLELRFEFGFDTFNPSQGSYNYPSQFDNFVSACKQVGVRTSFKTQGPPSWNGGNENEPNDYPAYEESMRVVGAHYFPLGMDRWWILNEPETGGWWNGGWDGYYRFLDASYRGLKNGDSRINVIGPEMWSHSPGFADSVLISDDYDIFSVHYMEDRYYAWAPHSYFIYTEMKKTGHQAYLIDGEGGAVEDFGGGTWGVKYAGGAGMMEDIGIYKMYQGCDLDYGGSETSIFERYEPNSDIRVGQHTMCIRNMVDELAGVQVVRRLTEAPVHVLAIMFKRGSDVYVIATTMEAQVTQLMVINTSSPKLIIKDAFGNEYSAVPSGGKVKVMLADVKTSIHGLSVNDTFEWTYQTTNEIPQIQNPGTLQAVAGVPFRFKLDGRDPDGYINASVNRLPTWSIVSGPSGMTISSRSGLLLWTPSSAGTQNVTVSLTDPDGGSSQQTFSINVLSSGSNLPPKIISKPAPVTLKDGSYCFGDWTYKCVAVDPNGDPVSYSVSGPAGVNISSNVITWKPSQLGTYQFQVTASDGRGGQDIQEFEVTVVPKTDKALDGGMPPWMPTHLTVTDISDGVTLVWNKKSLGDTVVSRASSINGPYSDIAIVGTSWYKDNPPSGPVYYRVRAKNQNGESDPTAPVNGRNRIPVAYAGQNRKLSSAGNVSLNGSQSFDPDGDTLTYLWEVVTAPRGSVVTITNPTSATPTVNIPGNGKYTIRLTVSDGKDKSVPDTIKIILGTGDLEEVANATTPDRFITVGTSVTFTGSASQASNYFWRYDDLPVDGFVHRFGNTQQNQFAQTVTFAPPQPGVYTMMLQIIDDWMEGYPDITRVIVMPSVSGDTTPPATVNTLTVSSVWTSSVTLTWTATGDDGNTGTASGYDLRYAYSQISNETQFQQATVIGGLPAPKQAGQQETFTVTNLSAGTTYYFALKVRDEAFNWSGISNSPSGVTKGSPPQAVKILLSANPQTLPADGASSSVVTARVCDANNNTVVSSTATVRFTLTGSGTLQGQNPQQVNQGIATITYIAGSSAGTVTITATSQGLTQGTVNITLQQAAVPSISVSSSTLEFGEVKIGETATIEFYITNTGGGTLSGSITDDKDWIEVQPASFYGNNVTVNVTVDNSILNMRSGQHTGKITITSNGGTAEIEVILNATCVLTRPNPYEPDKGSLEFFGSGIVPGNTSITIYTLSNEMIKKLFAGQSQKTVIWDGITEDGKKIIPGIYIYKYESPKEKGIGKFTVK